jgi:hypothetical protein
MNINQDMFRRGSLPELYKCEAALYPDTLWYAVPTLESISQFINVKDYHSCFKYTFLSDRILKQYTCRPLYKELIVKLETSGKPWQ